MYDYYCWLGVAIHSQLYPDMSRLTKGEFDWSEGGLAPLEVSSRSIRSKYTASKGVTVG